MIIRSPDDDSKGYGEDAFAVNKYLRERKYVSEGLPAHVKLCLENRVWEKERISSSGQRWKPVSFEEFVHGGGPCELHSTYEEIETNVICYDRDLIRMWKDVSGRPVEFRDPPKKPIRLNIEDIRLDGGTQARVKLDQGAIDDYAERYAADQPMDPVETCWDGETHWLVNGFHRVHAAKKAGKNRISAVKVDGTKEDAILLAAAANQKSSVRRTNADKRRAVEMVLSTEKWRNASARQIADHCGVGNKFVGDIRKQLCSEHNCDVPDTVIGAGGKPYPATRPKKPTIPPTPETEPTDSALAAGSNSGTVSNLEMAEAAAEIRTQAVPPPAPEADRNAVRQLNIGESRGPIATPDELVECALADVEALSGSQLAVFAQRLTDEKRAALAALLTGEVPRSTTG